MFLFPLALLWKNRVILLLQFYYLIWLCFYSLIITMTMELPNYVQIWWYFFFWIIKNVALIHKDFIYMLVVTLSNKQITFFFFSIQCIQWKLSFSEKATKHFVSFSEKLNFTFWLFRTEWKSPNNFWTKFEKFGYSCRLHGTHIEHH